MATTTPETEKRHRKIDQILANCLKPGPEVWYWDTEIKQFAIRVRPRSVQYLLRKRYRGVQRTWRIGDVALMKAATARARVITARMMVDNDEDPEDWLREQELGHPLKKADEVAAPEPQGWTFREMLEGYLESDKRKGKRSNEDYESAFLRAPEMVARHALPAAAITSHIVSDIRDELRRRVSARRTKCILDYLSGAFQWATKEPKAGVTANPIKEINLPEGKSKPKTRWLPMEEVRLLLNAVQVEAMDASIRHLLLFTLLTGQRKSAALNALIKDILHDEEHGHHIILRENKDGEEEHVVPLSPMALALVETCREVARERKSVYLFPASRAPRSGTDDVADRPITENAVNTAIERMVLSGEEKQVRKAKADAALIAKGKKRPHDPERRGRGIRKEPLPPPSDGILFGKVAPFGPHDFRRTISTNLAKRRSDPRWGVIRWYVSALLDHKVGNGKDRDEFRSDMTEEHYTVYEYAAEKRIAAEKWAELVIAEAEMTSDAWLRPLEDARRKKDKRTNNYQRAKL